MKRVASHPGYELIDFGGGARLERFGERVVDRPHPGALGPRVEVGAWQAADLHFDRERGWTGPLTGDGSWTFEHEGIALELRATQAGQVGLFPEQLEMVPWLRARVRDRVSAGRSTAVLHLFAYTGLATLAMAAAGAEVAHVDASRPTVAWARRNAELSGLADSPTRWIVDDAVDFTEREARRGRRYAGIVLDPPTYGHAPRARAWQLEDGLPLLLAACERVIEPDGFVLLTAHTPGFDAPRLIALLGTALGPSRMAVEGGELALETGDDRRLELGAFARTAGTA